MYIISSSLFLLSFFNLLFSPESLTRWILLKRVDDLCVSLQTQEVWRQLAEINRVKERRHGSIRRLIWKINEGDKELLVIYDVRSDSPSSPPARHPPFIPSLNPQWTEMVSEIRSLFGGKMKKKSLQIECFYSTNCWEGLLKTFSIGSSSYYYICTGDSRWKHLLKVQINLLKSKIYKPHRGKRHSADGEINPEAPLKDQINDIKLVYVFIYFLAMLAAQLCGCNVVLFIIALVD